MGACLIDFEWRPLNIAASSLFPPGGYRITWYHIRQPSLLHAALFTAADNLYVSQACRPLQTPLFKVLSAPGDPFLKWNVADAD